MMKQVLIFLAGLTVGGLGGWIASNRKCAKTMSEAVEARVRKALENSGEDYVIFEHDNRFSDQKEAPPQEPLKGPKAPYKPKGSYETDYTKYYVDPAENEHPLDDEEIREQETIRESYEIRNNNSKPPKLIKKEDFGEIGYQQVFVTYYTGSETLIIDGDHETISLKDLDEVASMLGDAMTRYGFKDNDEEEIFVRNFSRQCDYSITKVAGYPDD